MLYLKCFPKLYLIASEMYHTRPISNFCDQSFLVLPYLILKQTIKWQSINKIGGILLKKKKNVM